MADIPPDDGAYPVVADAAPLLPVQPELAWDLGTETRDAVSDVYLVTFARLLPGTAQAAGLQDIVFTRVRVGCLSRLFTSMHPPHSPLFNIYVSAVWPTRPPPLVGQGRAHEDASKHNTSAYEYAPVQPLPPSCWPCPRRRQTTQTKHAALCVRTCARTSQPLGHT